MRPAAHGAVDESIGRRELDVRVVATALPRVEKHVAVIRGWLSAQRTSV
jgi:hypothetical protein